VDLTEILSASRRATLHDFMALSYGPSARASIWSAAWVPCVGWLWWSPRKEFLFGALQRPQERASIASNASARCQHCRRVASRTCKVPKKLNRVYLRDRKPPQSEHSTESGHMYISLN